MKNKLYIGLFIIICFSIFPEDFSGWKTHDSRNALEIEHYNEMDEEVNPYLSFDIFSNGKNESSFIKILGEEGQGLFNIRFIISGYRKISNHDYDSDLFLYIYLDGKLVGAHTIGDGNCYIGDNYYSQDKVKKDIKMPMQSYIYLDGVNGLSLLKNLTKAKSASIAEFVIKDYKDTIILSHSIKCNGMVAAIKKATSFTKNDEWQFQLGIK